LRSNQGRLPPNSRNPPVHAGGRSTWIKTTGCDHAGEPPQRDLPPFSEGRPRWHGGDRESAAMIEIVAALLAFLSISVFLAHAFDAYRSG
jgi:hypothetical protein